MGSVETAGLVGVIMALIELLKFTIQSFKEKKDKNSNKSEYNEVISKLDALSSFDSKTDANGIPLSYSPRSPSQSDLEILSKLEKSTFVLGHMVEALEKMTKLLEKIYERQISEKNS